METPEERLQKKAKKQKEFFSRISSNLNVDTQATLNKLNFDYLETSIEFGNDLINVLDALSNWEYTTKKEYVVGQETNLTRIIRIDGYEEQKEELIKIIDEAIMKMKEAIKGCVKIKEYYNPPPISKKK